MAARNRKIVDTAFLASLETLDLYIRTIMSGRFGGSRRAKGYGSSCEFADYREYTPGDDLRRLDWNLVGRLEKYYIKQFVDERQMETHVYLDMSASMDADAEGIKATAALQLASAVGYLSVQNMDRVAFRLLEGACCRDLCGAIMGREAFYGAAEQLAGLTFAGEDKLDQAIMNDPEAGYNNGISIIISDFLTDSDWKSAVDYLLNKHREVALIQVLSPQEENPMYTGALSLLDSEAAMPEDKRHMRLSVDRGALRAYQQALSAMRHDMQHFCDARNISYLSICGNEPVENILIKKGFMAGLIR